MKNADTKDLQVQILGAARQMLATDGYAHLFYRISRVTTI